MAGKVGRPRKEPVPYRPSVDDLVEELRRRERCRWYRYFADGGAMARGGYPKHLAFMRAGAKWRQRAMCAANRVGKSDVAAYEITCHLTGMYPAWWEGRRFDKPTEWWAAGDTAQTTRDIMQVAFLGPTGVLESQQWAGMIPATLVHDVARKPGVPGGVTTIWVKHASGGMSSIDLKSYDQKREAFQGTAKAGVWLDEEPPDDIYGECLIRTMTTNGLMVVTFTPLQGLTPFIASWLERSVIEVLGEDGRSQLLPSKGEVFKGLQSADVPDVDAVAGETPKDEAGTRYLIMATWDDAPHLSAEAKAAMLAEFPPHQRDARSKGIPALGSGIIYPVPENEIRIAPFEIPSHWPRAFGMDTDAGAGWTAAVWAAMDPASKTYYLYDVYKRSHAEVAVHAAAIKARGAWIPGVADAAALLVTNQDAQQLIKLYQNEGLDIVLPDKAVEAGIQDVWTLLSSGRLKVFSSCGAFFDEFRLYRRDSKGRIVKQNDHVVDACVVGHTVVQMGGESAYIADLVGHEGTVLTVGGKTAPYMGARKVFDDVPLVRVKFRDTHIDCTPDHPFLTFHGWVRADQMAGEWCQNVLRTPTHGSRFAWDECLDVRPCGHDDVYCLTVPGYSAFAVGTGQIVHNTRYLVRSGIKRMKVGAAPAKPSSGVRSFLGIPQSWLG